MKKCYLPLLISLLPVTQMALGASVTGTIVTENDQPIAQSTICLSTQTVTSATTPTCLQTQTTDAQGNYAFNAIDAGTYVVTITDQRFPTYTWLPVARKVTLAQSTDALTNFNFKRQFSFSNFQKAITINSTNLPELDGFNLNQDTVFVKLYAVNPANPAEQIVFFIGQVTNNSNLNFAASAPWTVKEVKYEIFSATASSQGSLFIQS